ncbi:hypothetical protein BJY01DRAFT_248002 [Aspergillus pseudoustus]|uniref:Serpin domain-containing protein n=1 Tax=Aspergillus pseudoustus TaxID=1810923 RepID=A0ABR4JXR8_9EURO
MLVFVFQSSSNYNTLFRSHPRGILVAPHNLALSHIVLINALVFKARWETSFDPKDTVTDLVFDTTKQVQMMFRHRDSVLVSAKGDYTAVRLPSIRRYDKDNFHKFKVGKFGLPKFNLQTKDSIKPILQDLGYPLSGNFSAMASGDNFRALVLRFKNMFKHFPGKLDQHALEVETDDGVEIIVIEKFKDQESADKLVASAEFKEISELVPTLVFIITGVSSGVGKELATILFARHGKVYLATRSETKTKAVIDEIRKLHPISQGDLIHLSVHLDDLSTIKQSAQRFLARESRLDVLWNNAAVIVPPKGLVSAQGHEIQYAVNCVGHFLFTKLMQPVLLRTARVEAAAGKKDGVRVVWVSSSAADHVAKPAIDFDNMDYRRDEGIWSLYARSKAGNVLQAVEFARRADRVATKFRLMRELQLERFKWRSVGAGAECD